MSDREFLIWIHERLRLRGDSEAMDFMHRLRNVIYHTAPGKDCTVGAVTMQCGNDLQELRKNLAIKDAWRRGTGGNLKQILAFLAGLIVGGLACIADCRAQTIGINTVTAHTGGGYRWDTPGLYVRRDDGLTLGALRNSLGRTSLHLSQTWERGPWAVQAGAITGYPMAPVLPLLTGSVLIAGHHRLILIPGPRNRMALHYAVEWK